MACGKLAAVYDPDVPHLRDALGTAKQPSTYWPDTNWRAAVGEWLLNGNDTVGDCTIVAPSNATLAFTTYAGKTPRKMNKLEALTNYSAVSGYRIGRPDTDRGALLVDVMKYWQRTGLASAGGTDKIEAFAYVNPHDVATLRQAIATFGGLVAGLMLPDYALTRFSMGRSWDLVSSDPGTEGHCVWVCDADAYGLWVVTWKTAWRITWAAWLKWADETFVVYDPAFLTAKGTNPADVGLPQMRSAMAAFQGK